MSNGNRKMGNLTRLDVEYNDAGEIVAVVGQFTIHANMSSRHELPAPTYPGHADWSDVVNALRDAFAKGVAQSIG